MDAKYKKFFKGDKLDVHSDVISFAHLIEQEKHEPEAEAVKVYAISAEFGIGKTFFCDRLKDVLGADGIASVVPVAQLDRATDL